MPRIILIVLLIVLAILLVAQLVRYLRTRRIDWTGITFAISFIALAFYLRFYTPLGY